MTPDMTYKSLLSDYNQVWPYGKIVADMSSNLGKNTVASLMIVIKH